MAKKKSKLLQEVKELPDPRCNAWYSQIEDKEPEFFAELKELVQLWQAGDPEVRRKLPKKYKLARFIANKVTEIGKQHGISLSESHAFKGIIKGLGDG